jgi:hypothetical protein
LVKLLVIGLPVADNFKPNNNNNNNNNNNILARKSYCTLFLVCSKPSEPEVVIQQVYKISKFLDIFGKTVKSDCWLHHVSVCLPTWNYLNPTGQIFMILTFHYFFFFNLLRQFRLHHNLTRITNTLHQDLCGWILLRMRNVSHRFVEKTETHILYSITLSKIVLFMRKIW